MGLKITFFMFSLVSIPLVPVIAQSLSGTGAVDSLATGSAQFILAAFCVIMGVIIIKGFSMYRRDMQGANEKITDYMEQETRALTRMVADHSVASTRLANATEAQTNASVKLVETVNKLSVQVQVIKETRLT